MTPIVHEVLKRASELLATEENWTQGRFARDRNNHPVDYTAENACKFCLRGAIKRAAFFCGDINHMAELEATLFVGQFADMRLVRWNDDHTRKFADVRYVLDRALES